MWAGFQGTDQDSSLLFHTTPGRKGQGGGCGQRPLDRSPQWREVAHLGLL